MIYRIWWLSAPKIITVLFFLNHGNAIRCYRMNQGNWKIESISGKRTVKFHMDSSKTLSMPPFVDSTFLKIEAWGD